MSESSVHEQLLTLVQIMDPKMDSGCSMPDQDAAMEQFDPLDYTLPEEILGIMDQMLAFEVSENRHFSTIDSDTRADDMARRLPPVTEPVHLVTPEQPTFFRT